MRMSEAIDQVATALAKAQAEIKGAVKDSTNPHFKNKYADLASVWDACRVPLTKNGLSVVQSLGSDGASVRITTMLMHSSGQWLADDLLMPAGATAQTAGSAITYGRRYALAAFAGVAPEDDDANAASHTTTAPATAQARPQLALPVGYANWWEDMKVAADKGIKHLEAEWKRSLQPFRDYTLEVRSNEWASLKSKAGKVAA